MDEKEYINYLNGHINRVVMIGMYISNKFYQIDNKELNNYLKLHDKPKYDYLPFLIKIYGSNNLSLDDKYIINKINKEEELIKKEYFDKIFKEIEILADFIDRGMDTNASKEFGRPMIKASGILKGRLKEIAKHCELNYYKII